MDTQVMKYFLDIVKYESFSEAAFHNNISQSSISKHIINLEKETGCVLFDRSKRHIRLTMPGMIFFDHVQKLLGDYEEMLSEMKSNTDAILQTINISLHRRSFYYNIPAAILEFKTMYPTLSIDFETISSRAVIENLYDQRCSFGVLYDSGLDRNRIEIDTILRDEVVLVLSNTHKLANRSSVSIHELAGIPLIFYPKQSQMSYITDYYFNYYNVTPNVFENARFPEPALSLLNAYSLGMVNLRTATTYFNLSNVKVIPFEENLSYELVLARPKGPRMTHFERLFKEYLLEYFRSKAEEPDVTLPPSEP